MQTDPSNTSDYGFVPESHDDARLALRGRVRTTLADLAEMDRLLEKAECLISRGFTTGMSDPAADVPPVQSPRRSWQGRGRCTCGRSRYGGGPGTDSVVALFPCRS